MLSTNPQAKLHYNYAHMVLPMLVLMNPKKANRDLSSHNAERYLRSLWEGLEGRMGVKLSSSGLGVNYYEMDNSNEAFIIHLPKPIEISNAFLTAAVFVVIKKFLNKEVLSARYFTLELGNDIIENNIVYYFCEWAGSIMAGGKHVNYGQLLNKDQNSFIAAIRGVL